MPALTPRLRSDLLLLLTAIIWGFAFVAQRTGTEHLGPFTFNAVRFAVGAAVLLPVVWLGNRWRPPADRGQRTDHEQPGLESGPFWRRLAAGGRRSVVVAGAIAGAVLFAAAALQQAGIVFTTAGKAGFITSLYVVLVPLLGLLLGQRAGWATWFGALLAAAGLYFLTMQGSFRMASGDFLVLLGAGLWAVHFLLLGRLSPGRAPVRLAFVQFATCAVLSAAAALLFETVTIAALRAAAVAILFTGILSVGVGYTLQVAGQRHAPPADAAILLSLEAVFAVVGGRLLLGEQLTPRALLGCALMLGGILVSQLWPTAAVEVPGSRGQVSGGVTNDERRVTSDELTTDH